MPEGVVSAPPAYRNARRNREQKAVKLTKNRLLGDAQRTDDGEGLVVLFQKPLREGIPAVNTRTITRLLLIVILLGSSLSLAGCNKKRYRIVDPTTEYVYYARKVKEKRDGALRFQDTLMNTRIELEDWEVEEMKKKDWDERVEFHRGVHGEMGGPDLRRIREAEEFGEVTEEESGS